MRKSRGGKVANNSSSMASNSACSHTTNADKSNLVATQEIKIRNLLKELQNNVKSCEEVRLNNQQHLDSLSKTHEKLKNETKLSTFYRKKLHSLYTQGIDDADKEIKSIKRALDCIKDVRTLQSEIHLIKSNSEQNNKDKTKICMRRGVLMNILQQASLTLPLWVGEIGQSAPPLCGCIQHIDDYICKTGDKVAARVRNQEEEENWILAEVVSFSSDTDDYVVDDIDSEYGQERYTVTRELVVPLPLWRANPLTDIEAIFPKDAIVLALYPQTTCFYRGIVNEPPRTPQEDYLILFEDSSYLEGYSPPLSVAQLYVVAYKDIQ